MNKFNLVQTAVLAGLIAGLSGTASAAEVGTWNGWSTGVYIGDAYGKSKLSTGVNASDYFTASVVDGAGAVEGAGSGSRSSNNFLGGVSIGYDKEFGNVLVGGEFDYTNFNRDVSQTTAAYYPCCVSSEFGFTNKVSVSSDWLMTARTRVGYVNGNSLTYLTGGLAATDLTVKHEWVDSYGANAQSSRSNLKLGWTLGVGYEHLLGNNWSIKGEYLYANFGSFSSQPGPLMLGTTRYGEMEGRGDMSVQMLRVGL